MDDGVIERDCVECNGTVTIVLGEDGIILEGGRYFGKIKCENCAVIETHNNYDG